MTSPAEKLARIAPSPVGLAWLGLPTAVSARIAALAGFPAGVIDREHGQIGIETAAAMIAALRAEGAAAIVRVPSHDRGAVQHALDAGAAGVILPYVETPEEAAAAVRMACYPPLGARGAAGAVIAATGYGADAAYAGRWNDEGLVIVQIESRRGLAAAPAIAAVPGVDMLFFGPFDFAQDAGLDPAADDAALSAVFGEIVAAARSEGRVAGVFPWPGATAAALAEAGADAIALASDIVALRAGLAAAAR